ncbi:MAG TPA: sugar ABC transporter substrate-binding protein [Eubacteriales bacterium]|nr:sugar ABC transporter substrate-binding protein [Eubacteriales bacterium]
MKKALALILALMMVFAFTACTQESATTTSGDEAQAAESGTELPESITYVTLGSTGLDTLKQAAEEFESETGVEVIIEDWAYSDAYQKILTLAEGGNMPDAMYGFASWTREFKEAGYISCAEDYIGQDLFNDFSEAARSVCSVDGKMWTMPSYMSVRTILFNQNMLDAAGVSVPTTWDELLEIAPKLYDPENGQYAYSLVAGHAKNTLDCFLPILWAYGADVTNEDGTANGFANEEGIAALQMYVDLAQYAVPDYGEATINETQSNFTNQVAAAYFHNAQGMRALADAGEDYSWVTIAEPLAGPDGEKYALGVMDIDILFATGNEEITAKFLELWHTAQYQGSVIEDAGWVPNQQSYFDERPAFSDETNVMVAPFCALEPIAKFKPSLIGWEEIQKVMADYVTKAVMGEMSATDAFTAAGEQVDKLLAD